MYRIVKKEALKPTVILYEIEAPMVAKKAEPGQFIILRVDENGERIPITIHDYDREKGTVTIIVQTVGATTEKLSHTLWSLPQERNPCATSKIKSIRIIKPISQPPCALCAKQGGSPYD